MSLWRTNTGELVGVADLLFGDWIGLERIRTCVMDELDGDLVAALPLCGCCDRVMALMDSADLRCAFRRIGRLAMVIKKSLGIGKGRRWLFVNVVCLSRCPREIAFLFTQDRIGNAHTCTLSSTLRSKRR